MTTRENSRSLGQLKKTETPGFNADSSHSAVAPAVWASVVQEHAQVFHAHSIYSHGLPVNVSEILCIYKDLVEFATPVSQTRISRCIGARVRKHQRSVERN